MKKGKENIKKEESEKVFGPTKRRSQKYGTSAQRKWREGDRCSEANYKFRKGKVEGTGFGVYGWSAVWPILPKVTAKNFAFFCTLWVSFLFLFQLAKKRVLCSS